MERLTDMNQNDKISVIVPVYNVEKYIRCCVDSIIDQTYENIEIILVDDGSTDSSGTLCDEYLAKESNNKIIKVIHKENGGLSSARNAGKKLATGKYIGYVDSDDYINPKMYETMLEVMKKTCASIVVCRFDYVSDDCVMNTRNGEDGIIIGTFTAKEALNNLLIDDSSVNSGIMCDKLFDIRLFDGLEFPVGRQHEDEFLIHRLFGNASKITYLNNKFYYYRMRHGSIMNKFSLKNVDLLLAHEDRIQYYKSKFPDILGREIMFYANQVDYIYFKVLRCYPMEILLRKDIRRKLLCILTEAYNNMVISKKEYNDYLLFTKQPLIYKLRKKLK